MDKAEAEVRVWARQIFPCEKPCDAVVICDNCQEFHLVMCGASKTLASLKPDLDKLLKALDDSSQSGCPIAFHALREWAGQQ